MPYRKVGNNDYVSPNGKHINRNQLRLWYANGEKWPGEKTGEGMSYSKGSRPRTVRYAEGGPVLGKVSNFMKVPDEFRDPDEGNPNADEDQMYAKSGEGAGKGFIKPDKSRSSKVIK